MINIEKQKGITIVSLIITIILMLIIASVIIGQMNKESVIKEAEEAKLMVDYQMVKRDLEVYKLKYEDTVPMEEKFTDTSLIGIVYKKVFVTETNRELGVIVDFEEIDSKPTYGDGGEKILKEDNNDKETVKEVEVLYDLIDVYVVDLADGNLYYVNGKQIYTLDGEKVEVAENEGIVNKYVIETVNKEYNNPNKFITKWNITLGETEGSETYSTVVLPVHRTYTYDATIDWGDGTSTLLQHRTNGVTLTDAELKEKVTHNYILANNDDGIRTIEISGVYSGFNVGATTSTPTKLKLIGIEQWGNVSFTSIGFSNCTNLTGIIPKNDLIEIKATISCFDQTAITGLEEGFSFSSGDFRRIFRGCTKLETIPNSLKVTEGITDISSMFYNCTSLKNIPESFIIPEGVTKVNEMLFGCSSLEALPENFKLPSTVINVGSLFCGCTKLIKLPDEFYIPSGVNHLDLLFNGCSSLIAIPENFTIPEGVTSIKSLFAGCSKLTQLPENFIIPASVNNMGAVFNGSGIESLPEKFNIPNGVTTISNIFGGCTKLTQIPDNLIIPGSVTQMTNAFRNCSRIKGSIILKANPTTYTTCFGGAATNSGSTLTVNYSSNCTNIDDIIATGSSTYIVKGTQID